MENRDTKESVVDMEKRPAKHRKGRKHKKSEGILRGKWNKRPFKLLLIAAGVVLLLILALLTGFFLLKFKGQKALMKNAGQSLPVMLTDEEQQAGLEEGTLMLDGKLYRYKEDVINILCMGIDTEGSVEEKTESGMGGQADAIFLLVIDPVEQRMKILGVSRDTMTDVEINDAFGNYMKTEPLQLALQYSYGDGKESSCELMTKAVSNLLYGVPIHGYCSVNLDAITVINDAVGGVEVTVPEDLTSFHPDLKAGRTLRLTGKQAYVFVQGRSTKEEGSSYKRMERQKTYMLSFVESAKQAVKQDMTLPVELFQELSDYMVTNIGVSEVTYLASQCLNAQFDSQGIVLVPGQIEQGEFYEEFYTDEEALRQLLIETFYEEVPDPQPEVKQ